MGVPNTFATVTTATGQQLDDNFTACYQPGGALGTPASGVTDNLTTTTSTAAITDTDFVDITLAAGGKRNRLWSAVKTYLATTFAALGGSATQVFSVAAATTGNHAIRASQGLTSNGQAAYSTNAVLTSSDFGKEIFFYGSATANTLPAASSGTSGNTIAIYFNVAGTLTCAGTDIIYTLGSTPAVINALPGDSIILATDAANWSQVARTVASSYAEAITTSGSPVSLAVTATTYNVATLALTKGTWLAGGSLGILHGSVDTVYLGGISATSATIPGTEEQVYDARAFVSGATNRNAVPSKKIVMAADGNVYLTAYAAFTGTAPGAYGKIYATRLSA